MQPMGGRPIQQLYHMLPHQMQPAVADVGPNNNSAQQLRKNEVKGSYHIIQIGKTTPTQSQPQILQQQQQPHQAHQYQ